MDKGSPVGGGWLASQPAPGGAPAIKIFKVSEQTQRKLDNIPSQSPSQTLQRD